MDPDAARAVLDRLIRERGENYGALSRMLGRNPAYIQQFIKRGTPRKLDEADRRRLARFFGVNEEILGGEEQFRALGRSALAARVAEPGARSPALVAGLAAIGRLRLGVSAGPGSLDFDERVNGVIAFDPQWLKLSGLKPENLSILHVDGESMAPLLNNGDDIMVDRSDSAEHLRDGVYVLRFDDALMVKRIARAPRPRPAAPAAAEFPYPWILTISSDNPHYPTWEDVDPDLVEIVGRVVWTGRRLL